MSYLKKIFDHGIFGLLFLASETKTIQEFGGKADNKTDNGPAFIQAFAFAQTHPGTTLKLGGKCRVSTSWTNETRYRYITTAYGITNLTIQDGEVILDGTFSCFIFEKCKSLTLKNVAFDYDPPLYSQGKVLSSVRSELKVTVVPDPGYPEPYGPMFSNGSGNWMTVHKPGGEYGFQFVGFIKASVPGENGSVTLTHDRGDLAAQLDGAKDWRYVRVQRGFGHLNMFKFCDELRLEGVRIHAASAFASLFIFCNDAVIVNSRIAPREGSDRMVSSCADGFHFIGARRGPKIEGNFFDRMQDDNIVISLRGSRVKSVNGDKLELNPHSVTWYEVGDTIELVEINTGIRSEYKIKSMPLMDNLWNPPVMTLDRPIEGKVVATDTCGPDDLPTLAFNKSWRLDGTVIRNNRFQNTRRFAVFMGAGGVRIENNIMSNHTSAALLFSQTHPFIKSNRADLIYYLSENFVVASNRIYNAQNYGEGGRIFAGRMNGAIDLYDFEGSGGRDTSGLKDAPLARNLEIR
ncbi:MAG: right-handed parallel beta-helix repeat-containing protein, partial [Spirochaetia bacterium]|nr:right-handed parallel beta-helix repeat-containing protein [Spirochaetia bacterium]